VVRGKENVLSSDRELIEGRKGKRFAPGRKVIILD